MQVLHAPGMRVQLLRLLFRRSLQKLLHAPEALVDGLVPRVLLPELAEEPVVGGPHGLDVLGVALVLLERVAHDALQVLDLLLQDGMATVQGRRAVVCDTSASLAEVLQLLHLLLERCQPGHGLVQCRVRRRDVLRVPTVRVAQEALHRLDPLGQCRMVRLASLRLHGMLAVGALQILHILPMLLRGLAQQVLDVIDALLQRGVMRIPHVLLVREEATDVRLMRRSVLGQSGLQVIALRVRGGDLPHMTLGVVSQGCLDLFQAGSHRGMVRIARLVLVEDPCMRGFHGFQLLRMLVTVGDHRSVEILHLRPHGLMLQVQCRLALGHVRVRLLEVADRRALPLAGRQSVVDLVQLGMRVGELPRMLLR
mmetsp:Transcript_51792/g.150581  ORF Transcript_51792/g.150581 Transcript_51792/m.150581 type:complete len:367 (+) Transcript_51792:1544-2644(+)